MCVCGVGGGGMASGIQELGQCPSDGTDTCGTDQMQRCNSAGETRETDKEPHIPGSCGRGRQWCRQDGATCLDL